MLATAALIILLASKGFPIQRTKESITLRQEMLFVNVNLILIIVIYLLWLIAIIDYYSILEYHAKTQKCQRSQIHQIGSDWGTFFKKVRTWEGDWQASGYLKKKP